MVGAQVCTGAHRGWLRPDLANLTELSPQDVDGMIDAEGDGAKDTAPDRFAADC